MIENTSDGEDGIQLPLEEIREVYRILDAKRRLIDLATSCPICHATCWHMPLCPFNPRWLSGGVTLFPPPTC